ncbi:MAG: XRE family transcriptional regulator [Candidatus Melainabacteria bacterium]|nr:MAG: XRE family transcriptional regulator [Candidatus Melainabacteria bacterium]
MTNNSTFLKTFGDTITSRRKLLQISQKDLSERCGVDRAYICHLESGRRNPSIELFNRVAIGLKMKPSRLLAMCERNAEITVPLPTTSNGAEAS